MFIAFAQNANAQSHQYVGVSNRANRVTNYVLTDTLTGTKYILDSARRVITAVNNTGKQLWQTDPRIDAKLHDYRSSRGQQIIYFKFNTDSDVSYYFKGLGIDITYSNSQFGIINCQTGKFHFRGQD